MIRTLMRTAGKSVALIMTVVGSTYAQGGKTKARQIANAMAAGPTSISAQATIMDWPDKSGKQAMLRQGSNGWVCMPSQPTTRYVKNNALCIDGAWQELFGALLANRKPNVKVVGYAYMLTNNTREGNTQFGDPGPTATNQWHHAGPHIMIVYPDPEVARAASSDPHGGGPYVMWKDTPYAHVMLPIR